MSMFRDSREKQVVRQQIDLPYIIEESKHHSGSLSYFGLPGGKMHDVIVWLPYLRTIAAVERSEEEYYGINRTIAFHPEISSRTYLLKTDVDALIFQWAEKKEPELQFPYDLINLDYVGSVFTGSSSFETPNAEGGTIYFEEHSKRIRAIEKLIEIQCNEKATRFLLLLTINGSRGHDDDIMSLLEDAYAYVVSTNNNANEIYDWLEREGKQHDKLFVAVPLLLISTGGAFLFDVVCNEIVTYVGHKNRMVHFIFSFSRSKRKLRVVPPEKFNPIPLKKVKEVIEEDITIYQSSMPAFTEC